MSQLPQTRLPPATEQTGDRQTNAIQATLRRAQMALNARGAMPVTTAAITFAAGQSITIDHKLGRTPIEWSVSDVITGYGSFRRTQWSTINITIQSQNACTAVFKFA